MVDHKTLEKTRLQLMQHEATMEDESQRCSELHVPILTSVSDSKQNSRLHLRKEDRHDVQL